MMRTAVHRSTACLLLASTLQYRCIQMTVCSNEGLLSGMYMLLRQVATAATMSAAALEAMRMALHTLEETSSVSSKLGWNDSALLQSALKLAAVAAVSLLIGMP